MVPRSCSPSRPCRIINLLSQLPLCVAGCIHHRTTIVTPS
jgi:hypothetical protein